MRRTTPRTCLWPLVGCLCGAFVLSIGLTYRSNHNCYSGTCGEWLFPLQARLHVVVWYIWLAISVTLLGIRAFQPWIRARLGRSLGLSFKFFGKTIRLSGVLLVGWICILYGILVGIWWISLHTYFDERGQGLPGNGLLAANAMTGHLADVTMGMVLLPVSRHSALASFFKLAPSSLYALHMVQAYMLLALVACHVSTYVAWVALHNAQRVAFDAIYPSLNPTYLVEEVWPTLGNSLGIWRLSLVFTGTVSTTIMFAMFCTSFPAIRKRYFNLFYFTHLSGLLAVVVICLHASTMLYCCLPGLSMWILDWSMRLVELQEQIPARLTAHGKGWYSLILPLSRRRLSGCACHSPLAHFHIFHRQSSIRELHPFTTITHLASQKSIIDDDGIIEIQFLFRETTRAASLPTKEGGSVEKGVQWTNRLGSLTEYEDERQTGPKLKSIISNTGIASEVALKPTTSAEVMLRLEGPYFTAASPEQYTRVICLVAGTGLSGALAIAAAFRAQHSRKACGHTGTSSSPCSVAANENPQWQKLIIIWSVRTDEYVEMPFLSDLPEDLIDVIVHKTGPGLARLDIDAALRRVCGSGSGGGDTWAYISGPNGFISAAEKACSTMPDLTYFTSRWD